MRKARMRGLRHAGRSFLGRLPDSFSIEPPRFPSAANRAGIRVCPGEWNGDYDDVWERPIMRYVLGVDGGQTSTTAVIADETGCLLGIGHGGPANHIHEPGGVERIRRSLSDAIRGAVTMADLENARIAAAC